MSHNIVLQLFFSLINGGNVTEMRSIQTGGTGTSALSDFSRVQIEVFQPVNEDLIRQLVLGFIILKISDKIHDTLASCWQLTDRIILHIRFSCPV